MKLVALATAVCLSGCSFVMTTSVDTAAARRDPAAAQLIASTCSPSALPAAGDAVGLVVAGVITYVAFNLWAIDLISTAAGGQREAPAAGPVALGGLVAAGGFGVSSLVGIHRSTSCREVRKLAAEPVPGGRPLDAPPPGPAAPPPGWTQPPPAEPPPGDAEPIK